MIPEKFLSVLIAENHNSRVLSAAVVRGWSRTPALLVVLLCQLQWALVVAVTAASRSDHDVHAAPPASSNAAGMRERLAWCHEEANHAVTLGGWAAGLQAGDTRIYNFDPFSSTSF